MKRSGPSPEHSFSRRPAPVTSEPSRMNITESVFRPQAVAFQTQAVHHGSGDQVNASGGVVNRSRGGGNNLFGPIFQQGANANFYTGQPGSRSPLEDCCKSLFFPKMNNRFWEIHEAAKETCEWLSLHSEYQAWIRDGGLLWIKGDPGSGKSTLLRHALSYSMPKVNADEEPLVLSFFFHGRGTELQRTPSGLFRSLLYQLKDISDALSDVVEYFQKHYQDEQWQWHLRQLRDFFKSSVSIVLKTRPLWLFVDALDECGKEEAAKLAEYLESLLESFSSTEFKQFRICFACRKYPILALDTALEIDVGRENNRDIKTYVQSNLSKARSQLSSEDLDDISKTITGRAKGIFLWARHVVDRILGVVKKGAGPEKIKNQITLVPEGLDKLYEELIQDMDPESWRLIQWVCFATRPLSLIEMRWAMLVEADCQHRSLQECQKAGDYPSGDEMMKWRLIDISCGLVEVTQDTNVVQFIHQSVHDFFLSEGQLTLARIAHSAEDQTPSNPLEGLVQYRLSRICIRYMQLNTLDIEARMFSDPKVLWSAFPLLHYAATSWAVHAKKSELKRISQVDILEHFNRPSVNLLQLWLRVFAEIPNPDPHPLEGTKMIHIVSRYGLIGPLQAILQPLDQERIDVDEIDSHGRTPLSWAAGCGQEAIVKILIDRGADTNNYDGFYMTPLGWAVKRRNEEIVKLVINKGARLDVRTTDRRTPLFCAVSDGHEAIVKVLIDKGARVDVRTKDRRTPLSYAAEYGYEAVVTLLVDNGANVNAKNVNGRTPLSFAAKYGHEAIVVLLIAKGANVNARNVHGRSPISFAAEGGHEAIVLILINNGANINAIDRYYLNHLLEKAIGHATGESEKADML